MPAKRTLRRIGLAAGDVIIDVGAGSGYFALPASRMVGRQGEVIAVDIAPEAIALIERKKREQGRSNVRTVLATGDSLGLPESIGSLAFLHTVLHEVDDKAVMLRALHRALRSRGRIAVVEFGGRSIFGPPRCERIGEAEMLALLTEAGFTEPAIQRWGALYAAIASK
jgi:FkbM family methyltransferase